MAINSIIRLANDSDLPEILSLLKHNIYSAVYIYIDIVRYGIKTEFMSIFVEVCDDNNITSVIMKYNNTFQIYCSNSNHLSEDIINLIEEFNPSIVSGQPEIIHQLCLRNHGKYDETYGFVLEQPSQIATKDMAYGIATLSELRECAILTCSDSRLRGYRDALELEQQFIQRYNTNMGRHYIIHKDDKIIAHAATYAEISDLAVIGGVIVHPDYRGNRYGMTLYSLLSNSLISENKMVILFALEKDILQGYLKNGAIIRAEYGKLINNYQT